MKNDRTAQAVRQQLKAMDCKTYQIGIVSSQEEGKAFHFEDLTPAEVMAKIPDLKRLNAQGNHIFIQPAEDDHKMILVDDVSFDDIQNMAKNGHKPALTVETSPDNYQAWVKSKEPLKMDERAIVAKYLAKQYEADDASAQKRHYGRLAGFTNQKPEHANSHGRQPFVLLRTSAGEPATDLTKEIAHAQKATHEMRATKQANVDYLNSIGKTSHAGDRIAKGDYQALQAKYGQDYKPSEADWMVAKHLMKRRISKAETAKLIAKHSPDIEQRKRTVNVAQYVNRTVDNAAAELKAESPNIKINEKAPSRGPSGPSR